MTSAGEIPDRPDSENSCGSKMEESAIRACVGISLFQWLTHLSRRNLFTVVVRYISCEVIFKRLLMFHLQNRKNTEQKITSHVTVNHALRWLTTVF